MWNFTKNIVRNIKTGGQVEEQAITRLYQSDIRQKIIRYLMSKGAHQEDAEDIFQEGILAFRVNVKKGVYKGKGNIEAYLKKICWYQWLTLVNKQQAEQAKKDQLIVKMKSHILMPIDPMIREIPDQQQANIKALFSQVGKQCKKMIILKAHQYKNEEIMEELGLTTLKSTKTQLYKCRERLKKFLKANPALLGYLDLFIS